MISKVGTAQDAGRRFVFRSRLMPGWALIHPTVIFSPAAQQRISAHSLEKWVCLVDLNLSPPPPDAMEKFLFPHCSHSFSSTYRTCQMQRLPNPPQKTFKFFHMSTWERAQRKRFSLIAWKETFVYHIQSGQIWFFTVGGSRRLPIGGHKQRFSRYTSPGPVLLDLFTSAFSSRRLFSLSLVDSSLSWPQSGSLEVPFLCRLLTCSPPQIQFAESIFSPIPAPNNTCIGQNTENTLVKNATHFR